MTGMDLPSKLEMLLIARAWSRSELARRIKRPNQNVQNWCNGKEPKRSDLLRIARAFDVPVEYLIDDAQDDPPAPLLTSEERTLLDVIRASGRTPVDVLAALTNPPTGVNVRSTEPGLAPHGMPPASPGKPSSQAG